jgi:hypothetical protein
MVHDNSDKFEIMDDFAKIIPSVEAINITNNFFIQLSANV